MNDWLSEIERRFEGKMDLFDLATKGVPRMARVIREQNEILGSIYHHYENVGDAPIGHWIEAIEDMSDDAKELLK